MILEPIHIALYLFVKPLDRDTVKSGKVRIKDDGLAAKANDGFPGFWLGGALDGIHETTIPCRYRKSIAKYNSQLAVL